MKVLLRRFRNQKGFFLQIGGVTNIQADRGSTRQGIKVGELLKSAGGNVKADSIKTMANTYLQMVVKNMWFNLKEMKEGGKILQSKLSENIQNWKRLSKEARKISLTIKRNSIKEGWKTIIRETVIIMFLIVKAFHMGHIIPRGEAEGG